jgi:hypothetical protein
LECRDSSPLLKEMEKSGANPPHSKKEHIPGARDCHGQQPAKLPRFFYRTGV